MRRDVNSAINELFSLPDVFFSNAAPKRLDNFFGIGFGTLSAVANRFDASVDFIPSAVSPVFEVATTAPDSSAKIPFAVAKEDRREASPPPVEQSFCNSSASTPCLKAFPCIAATGTSGASGSKGPVSTDSAL